jgi:hypothetical protein
MVASRRDACVLRDIAGVVGTDQFTPVSDYSASVTHYRHMDVHLNNPDLSAKLDRWVAETGRGADELVEDAMAGYFEELSRTRETLNSRYDDLKSGRVKPIDGEQFFADLRRREDELLNRYIAR